MTRWMVTTVSFPANIKGVRMLDRCFECALYCELFEPRDTCVLQQNAHVFTDPVSHPLRGEFVRMISSSSPAQSKRLRVFHMVVQHLLCVCVCGGVHCRMWNCRNFWRRAVEVSCYSDEQNLIREFAPSKTPPEQA